VELLGQCWQEVSAEGGCLKEIKSGVGSSSLYRSDISIHASLNYMYQRVPPSGLTGRVVIDTRIGNGGLAL
jgi:hypothetical protein